MQTELTLQSVKDCAAFEKGSRIKEGLDSLVECWYRIEIKSGKTEKDALVVALGKLSEKINSLSSPKADALFPRQLHAVMLLFYADKNIDKDGFIDKCFAGETASMRIHLFEKFEHRNYSIFEFIADLDAIHRVAMIKYLFDNYKGFSMRDAEDYISYFNFNK